MLQVTIRTPKEMVLDEKVSSLRFPTHTGWVGLRPRSEPTVLSVDAGLILLDTPMGRRFVGTGGGLLRTDGLSASLLTPLAVAGTDVESVTMQLNRLLEAPNEEMDIRKTLGRLEKRILQEIHQKDHA